MARTVVLARYAQPGMYVRQQDLVNYLTPHQISTVSQEDLNAPVLITSNQGSWWFWPDEPLAFPRRPDGTKTDWREAEAPPTPLQLAIGDILPPREGHHAFANRSPQELQDAAESVTSVSRNPLKPKIIIINTISKYYGPGHFIFYADEPIQFPRLKTKRDTGATPQSPFTSKLQAHGPYLDIDHTTQDEYLVFYMRHPSGGGRWPRWLDQPGGFDLGKGIYLRKPPGKARWPIYVNTQDRWDRHPRDPGWGQPAQPNALSQERLAEALQVYTKFTESRTLAI